MRMIKTLHRENEIHFEDRQPVPQPMCFGSLSFPLPKQEIWQQGFSRLYWTLGLDLAVLVGSAMNFPCERTSELHLSKLVL